MSIHTRLAKYILTDPTAVVIDLQKSHGSWLVDTSGREYLDCFSQFASQPIGWNHPKLIAQKDRLADVALHKPANSDMYCDEYAIFVEKFASITTDFPNHFYISGGALGVENALKAAFDWKAQKVGHDDLDIIHLANAFHGRSGYTLSLTNNPHDDTKTRLYPKFKWSRVVNPAFEEDESLEQTRKALEKGNVAAVILEVIQGEGGDNHFSQSYLTVLRNMANAYDCLLIFDEVQTGVGLTGKMWAYQHFIMPDMICFGKKVQVCGFCASPKIHEVPENVFTVPSRINSTWGGSLVDMVRANIYLDIIAEDNLVENAAVVGEYFLQHMKDIGLNARGRGLMLAFELPTKEERDQMLARLNEKLLCLPSGHKSIRFRPHLTFTKEDADTAIDMIMEVL